MKGDKLRVLLVDDSPTVRAVLRRILRKAPELLVVGEAQDGMEAVTLAQRLEPDVILMDLSMPGLDGFAATERIMRTSPSAILVFSSEVRVGGQKTVFDAVEKGALGVLAKPETPAAWSDMANRLPSILRAVASDWARKKREGRGGPGATNPAEATAYALARPAGTTSMNPIDLVAIGASTGGPEALRTLLHSLGPQPPMRILVVQHIASEFEDGLVEWLAEGVGLDVALATDGERPPLGAVRLGPQGRHLRWGADERLHLDEVTPAIGGHRPSATELFSSCAEVAPERTAGVLLSGMGRDGVVGLLAMRHAGCLTVVQDRESSTIYGMPMAALEAGAAQLALAPTEIARHLLENAGRGNVA